MSLSQGPIQCFCWEAWACKLYCMEQHWDRASVALKFAVGLCIITTLFAICKLDCPGLRMWTMATLLGLHSNCSENEYTSWVLHLVYIALFGKEVFLQFITFRNVERRFLVHTTLDLWLFMIFFSKIWNSCYPMPAGMYVGGVNGNRGFFFFPRTNQTIMETVRLRKNISRWHKTFIWFT